MADNSNVPSAIRDSDTIEQHITTDRPSEQTNRTGSVQIQDEHRKVDLLEQKLVEQNKEIASLKTAFQSLQSAFTARTEKIEEEVKTAKEKTESLRKELKDKDDKLTELKQKLECLEKSADKGKESVTTQIQEINRNQMVCFSARVASAYQDIAPWATIVFGNVETNIGNAYNKTTGEFTAPRPGIYVFYSNILSKPGISIETVLKINDVNKQWLYSAGPGVYHGPGGNMLVTHLTTGDKVKMAKHGPWGTRPFYIHHCWSTFSGFLLRTDM